MLNMPPLLVILGATAVGKTALSLHIAEQIESEVVSADSRLFYRQMDIGTAKPTAAEMGDIPHHCIDIANPDETVTLGWYQRHCYGTIDAIHERGKLPILVGGTGQYVQAVVEGWGIPEIPPNDALRAELSERDAADLHAQLTELDAVAAAKLHPNNKRRVIRALEVCLIAGRPISDLQKKSPPPYNITIIGLRSPRKWLYERIDRRVDLMMEAGLLDEVKGLVGMGYGRHTPAMSGLGYQQLLDYLDRTLTLDEAVERIKYETHRFVRHQNNWFERQIQNVNWFDVTAADYPKSTIEQITAVYNKEHGTR